MKSMQTERPQLAIVMNGYYKQEENGVFGIYLLDAKKLLMIPNDKELLEEMDSFDHLGDTVNDLKEIGYEIIYDFDNERKIDVSITFPVLK